MACRFLLVPGLHGSGPGHWQSWWQVDHGGAAAVVEQDDWADPDECLWLERLEAAVVAHPGAILVGHSLGSVLSARMAGSRYASLVAGALLVAPADINRTCEVHRRSYEFGEMPRDRLPFPTIVAASRDDTYMRFDTASALACDWGASFLDMGHAGHINIASGFGRWPDGYALASRLERLAAARAA